MSSIRRHKRLLFILLGALVLRLGAAVALQSYLDHRLHRQFLIEGDANGYWELGERMAEGRAYELYEPPRRVLRMPGFPAILAASIKLADLIGLSERRMLVARCVLAIVGTVACGLVYLLGRELFDERVGLLSAAITAVLPVMIGFSVLILSETAFAACLVLSLLMMARLVKARRLERAAKPAIVLAFAVGASVALACYMRPSWLPAAPLFALAYLMSASNKKTALCEATLVMLGLAVTMAPWAIRNHQVTGHWVLTTLWLGPSLYDGLNPDATGDSDLSFFDRDALMAGGMSEHDVNRHYTKLALQYAREHPRRAIELALAKFARFWKPWPNAAQFDHWAARLAVAVFFIPAMLLAAWGWWACRREPWKWLLTAGPVLFFSALHCLFVGSLRYRLPAEYPLAVLTAVGALACCSGPWRQSRTT
ncbi:MAG: glycosyltransferase family 39 protein [Planctomycetaceae bacterium]